MSATKKNGYTLIEILIAIIIFSVILIPLYGKLDVYLKLNNSTDFFKTIYNAQYKMQSYNLCNYNNQVIIQKEQYQKYEIFPNCNIYISVKQPITH